MAANLLAPILGLLRRLARRPARGPALTLTPQELAAQRQALGAVLGRYRRESDIVYRAVGDWDGRLDVYRPAAGDGPWPTVVFFHGGGWTEGSKEAGVGMLLPYLEAGWAAVNVGYRLAAQAPAPAAAEDARAAVEWVAANAARFGFDPARLVLAGQSVGGHLALLAAFEGTGGARAVVNWFGPSDVNDLLAGRNQRDWAVAWMGGAKAARASEPLARRLSPLSHVRAGVPPVFTVHRDGDPVVPHAHSARLHEALERAGVPNQLVTMPGAVHGKLAPEERARVFGATLAFLAEHGIIPRTPERP